VIGNTNRRHLGYYGKTGIGTVETPIERGPMTWLPYEGANFREGARSVSAKAGSPHVKRNRCTRCRGRVDAR
jgi:hypothetical protein